MPRRTRRPRRIKQFHELTTLEGTEFYQLDNGITFHLEDRAVDQQIYMGDLLAKFYRINEDQPPLGFQLVEDERQAIREKFWYAVMRGNFFIRIEQHQSTEGPHRAELWFRAFTPPKATHWLASCQLMAFYFNEEQMKIATLQAVNQREFFMLPANRDKPVIL